MIFCYDPDYHITCWIYKLKEIKWNNILAIKNFSFEGATILDPFMGTGTVGIVCKNINRNFIGIEMLPNYFKIAEKRINENL